MPNGVLGEQCRSGPGRVQVTCWAVLSTMVPPRIASYSGTVLESGQFKIQLKGMGVADADPARHKHQPKTGQASTGPGFVASVASFFLPWPVEAHIVKLFRTFEQVPVTAGLLLDVRAFLPQSVNDLPCELKRPLIVSPVGSRGSRLYR
jgi:hypothetical protein